MNAVRVGHRKNGYRNQRLVGYNGCCALSFANRNEDGFERGKQAKRATSERGIVLIKGKSPEETGHALTLRYDASPFLKKDRNATL